MTTSTDTGALINMGEINARLGFIATGDFLAKLGFPPVQTERPGKLYRESDFPAICMAIVRHVESVANATQQAA